MFPNKLRLALLACGPLFLVLSMTGCADMKTSTKEAEPYSNKELIQSTHNRYANLAMRDNLETLRAIQLELYRLNPGEWRESPVASQDEAVERIWKAVREEGFVLPEFKDKRDIPAMNLALDPVYPGDRVAAFTYGLVTMLIEVYGSRLELRLIDGLTAEKLYKAARNVETAVRLLTERRRPGGGPLLVCVGGTPKEPIGIERQVGALVGRLDLLAANMDEKYRRAAINYLQGLVMGNFLELMPIQ